MLVAGSGVTNVQKGRIVGDQVELVGDHCEYVGVVGVKERNELMGKAHAILVPTTYIEPFGAVAVEAQLCGTPAIASDWGAFGETIREGVTGYRFRTLAQAVEAVEFAGMLEPERIRKYALAGYSLEVIGPMYQEWFERLQSLWGEGWYEIHRNGG